MIKNWKLKHSLKGNKNAVKWDEQTTTSKLRIIEEWVVNNPDILTLMAVQAEFNLPRNWFYYISNKFNNYDRYEEINDLIGCIYVAIEKRVWDMAADKRINLQLALFTLKIYHNRIEKQLRRYETSTKNSNNTPI
jgi:hypothetical protein